MDVRRPGGRQFIEPVLAIEDERPLMAQVFEDSDHQRREGWRANTERLVTDPTRVREGSEHVEHRPDPELASRGTGVAHRRMKGRRETEPHSRGGDTGLDAIRAERDVNAKGFQDVGTPASAGGGTIAMLGDPGPRAGRDKGGYGRDVEGARPISTGPAGIDRARRDSQRRGVGPHRVDEAGHLFHRFALCAQGDQQAGDLDRCRLPGHHLVHHGLCLVAAQRFSSEKVVDRVGKGHGRGY